MSYERPKRRQDCKNGIRPCPFITCKYNLLLDRYSYDQLENDDSLWDDGKPSCVLDEADKGGLTFKTISYNLRMNLDSVRKLAAESVRIIIGKQ